MAQPDSPPAPLKIVFAGTPDFAAHHLQQLLDSRHQVIAVYTQPDRPAGRGKKLTASPVKTLALQHQTPVLQPESLKGEAQQTELAALQADLMVVVAYGLLLPKAVLNTPRLGCINVHASLLPRWRGAAPIQRAIEAGDSETGVTVMQMDVGLDTGDMLLKARCPITGTDTADSIYQKLQQLGGAALQDTLELLAGNTQQPQPQDDSLSCYAPKLTKQEAALDWSRPAVQLHNQVRAFNPFPVCYSELQQQRIRIWQAAPQAGNSSGKAPGTILEASSNGILVQCGEGQLLLTELQLAGKTRMPVAEILKARAELFAPGQAFATTA